MSLRRLFFILLVVVALIAMAGIQTDTQSKKGKKGEENIIAGRNVNMVSGQKLPYGDPWLQRQNEPSIAVSTRNPLHLLAGANDYRTIDIPGKTGDELPGEEEKRTATAPEREPWLGVFKSFDGGQSWITTLHPGFPQDCFTGSSSPLCGYKAAADPVVRAGTNGIFYYCGIAFNRDTMEGVVFVSRFIDNNNLEKNDKNFDCIKYLDTKIIAEGLGGEFIDKPWIAVDLPHGEGQKVQIDEQNIISKHTVYIAFSAFTGGGEGGEPLKSKIFFARSTECGDPETWSQPIKLDVEGTNEGIYQGAVIGVDPRGNGHVYVAWRKFSEKDQPNSSIFTARSTNSGKKFSKVTEVASFYPFDQPSSGATFRTNSYPTLTIDQSGRLYLAWSHRMGGPDKEARIVLSTSNNGIQWSKPKPYEEAGAQGHQVMPSLTYAGGKLMMVWYDQREDITGNFAPYINDFVDEQGILRRHTLDVRVSQATPGPNPHFEPSKQVSRYQFVLTGYDGDYSVAQVKFNFVNFPLFKTGAWPFMGDYIDIAPSPMFVLDESQNWQFNTVPSDTTIFHAAWTDNRDVRPPPDGLWNEYNPQISDQDAIFQTNDACYYGGWEKAGMRNQNIYTSRITQGLIAGSPGNTKPLGTLGLTDDGENIPRAFVVFVKNTIDQIKSFRLTIVNQPLQGRASFLEFDDLYDLDVEVAPRSTVSRSVFVYSPDRKATVRIAIAEIYEPYGAIIPGGLESSVVLNPDIMNPDIMNPDIMNPDIMNYEVHNPDIMNFYVNPDIMNPDIMNPDIMNPDIMNPDIMNPDIMNWYINPDIMNPDIMNPDIMNPNIMNPNIMNPDIMNATIADPSAGVFNDVVWEVQNTGNTNSSYIFKTLSTAAQEDGTLEGIQAQLLIYKVYKTPDEYDPSDPCALGNQEHQELVLNIINPDIMNPDIMNTDIENPDIMNPDIMNATFALNPGGEAKVILRLWKHYNQSGLLTTTSGKILDFNSPDSIMENFGGFVSGTARETEDLLQGITTYSSDSSLFIITTKILASGEVGKPYSDFLTASGGEKPYAWSIIGSLPSGLYLNATTGEIYSDPTPTFIEGTYNFTAQVIDSGDPPIYPPQTRTKDLWIVISPTGVTEYTISGRVTVNGVGLEGVLMDLDSGNDVYTDSVGYYSVSVPDGWAGMVTPEKTDYTFDPFNKDYSNTPITSNLIGQNYIATPLISPLHHFDISTIPSPQTTGVPFSITITAKDSSGNTVTSYTGTNTLSDTTVTISPVTTGAFTSGSWTGNVTITEARNGVTIYTTRSGGIETGASNSFDVDALLDDSYEPNNDRTSAAEITLGTYTNLVYLNEDWYKINVTQADVGNDLKVHIRATSYPDPNQYQDLDFGIWNGSGKLLSYNLSGSDDETVYIADLTEGEYFIGINYFSQNGAVYTLTVEIGDSTSFGIGYIEGWVTEWQENGIEDILVDLYGAPFDWDVSRPLITTDSQGHYRIGYAPGDYQVRFNVFDFGRYEGMEWAPDRNYIGEYYDDTYSSAEASILSIIEYTTIPNIDAELIEGGSITGAITDPNGSPVGSAYVYARNLRGQRIDSTYAEGNGQYTLNRLPTGYFKVHVRPFTENYAAEWYDDKPCFDDADPVYVEAGQETSGKNIQLDEGAAISGRVTNNSEIGIEGVNVRAFDPTQTAQIFLRQGWTDSNGYYSIGRLPAGNVKVRFDPPSGYVREWYDDKRIFDEADLVPTTAGQTTEDIDAQLAEGGAVVGRVTDSGGDGLYNIFVVCWDINSENWYSTTTDAAGNYGIYHVPVGDYKVRFRANYGNYATEWHSDKGSYTAADQVTVTLGQETPVDAQLSENGGFITGRVTDGGNPIESVRVFARDSTRESSISWAFTDANGDYSIPRLPTCDAKVYFDTDANNLLYASEWYDDQNSYEDATLVPASLGDTTQNIDADLAPRSPLTITTTELPDGTGGMPYSATLEASGGIWNYNWSLASGSLPDGLSLHGNGMIDGTPTTPEDFSFSVQVVDSSYPPQSATLALSITIELPGQVPPTITTTSLPDGEVAVAYSASLTVIGGSQPYSWSLAPDSLPLPEGVLVLPDEGKIEGTPLWEGTYNFTVQVEDSSVPQLTATKDLSITINPYAGADHIIWGTVTYDESPLEGVAMNVDESPGPSTDALGNYFIIVTPGWSGTITPVLAGFVFDPPSRTYDNVTHNQDKRNYTAYVAGDLSVKTTWLLNGTEGVSYSETLEAVAGAAPYTWSLASGSLPAGLNSDISAGVISGIPTTPGTFNFTVQVTDQEAKTSDKALSIVINSDVRLSQDMITYWKFDEGIGTTAVDSSGKGVDGTLNGNVIYTSDAVENNAVETFKTAGGGWISASQNDAFYFADEATVMAYVKIADFNQNSRFIWKLQYDHPVKGWPYTIEIHLNINGDWLNLSSENGLKEGVWDADHFLMQVNLSDPASGFNVGEYNHIAVTMKDDVYKIFINGIEVASEQGALFTANDRIQCFWIMGADWSDYWLEGKMDELAVYNRTLSEGEIQLYIGYSVSGTVYYSITGLDDVDVDLG